ncbi:hypothetical protein BSZ39_10240 [Bowdeniella nasicola]|uniref:Endonuclease/exonuclease/phosphatase domain-containing protein n=1 Tax=Bowdeniella nasicola TaxID=208480 RepID=A0A1Q5Q0G7_9ACTO|nr:endonuclease/exonuclease/phosphatase family protein [Bowdeniella nasicola]OKL53287.1 hypothetical protein BSZ39_10240 [Bowdeniella nasicola]
MASVGRAVAMLMTLVVLLLAVAPSLPITRALSSIIPFAQMIAFPAPLGCLLVVVGVGVVWKSLSRRRAPLDVVSGVMCFLAGLVFVVFPDGFTTPRIVEVHPASASTLTIIAFNTQSTLSEEDLRSIHARYEPDVMVLPETSEFELSELSEKLGMSGEVIGTENDGLPDDYSGNIAPTTIWVNSRLGPVHRALGPISSFGTVAVEFEDQRLPRIIGVHVAPPLPGLMGKWKADLERTVDYVKAYEGSLIVAGDFNATLRHGALTSLRHPQETANQCETRGNGSWPTSIPSFLRARIDHILISGNLAAVKCSEMDLGSSDHAVIVSTIQLP